MKNNCPLCGEIDLIEENLDNNSYCCLECSFSWTIQLENTFEREEKLK